ncbi:YopR family type III secretion effector [Vibrio alginolyticus]|uniref:YopR family T3SS polymerization control protein n=1 Tax=Vibrio TaxID=662 RepID=UPI002806A7B0|nr:YopR family T3SS polymerization control protein [Vibrio sp. Vb0667]EGQ9574483.1 YopR family type III secretion effector [Vibrio alginolyticus]EIL8373065.1 YopR family T3SS polymerization control protein [Vibrio alginolyticus]ELA8262477.1 YopR family T3SS polymerization control protein [Vibrio alginolyticus]MDW3634339.1 YopR family T3SS polymerization control protein [Vibrio sp. Vb0667]
MIIDSSNLSLQHQSLRQSESRHYERSDEDKIKALMERSDKQEQVSHVSPKETLEKTEAKLAEIKAWYESLKDAEVVSKQSVLSSLNEAFSDPQVKREAMWYAFHEAKSAKGNEQPQSDLLKVLKQELLGNFSGQLIAEPPADKTALKAMLAQHFPLGAQKEQALWHCWAELKSLPDMTSTLDMVRDELSFMIQKNAMVKNIMTHSHKLDLS